MRNVFLYSPKGTFDIRLRLELSKANTTAYIEANLDFVFMDARSKNLVSQR